VIQSRDLDDVVEGLLRPRYNYGVPKVVITDTAQGVLRLSHDEEDAVLDREYAEKTLEYIHGLWKGPVLLTCRNEQGETVELRYDEKGPHVTVKGKRLPR